MRKAQSASIETHDAQQRQMTIQYMTLKRRTDGHLNVIPKTAETLSMIFLG